MADAGKKVQQMINDNAVVVFSKSYCPYCKATKQTLNNLNVDYALLELDNDPDGSALQEALEEISGQRTVPNVFIQQKHIGGNSDLQELFKSGKLIELVKSAGALKA
ncbi:hypothetical protein DCS_04174 [Drechmeria coniospora]|uniref:Glutaredoxin domain-containing protein n=1 Tax=Drechmeria coniospora TaxID=98403 RepID=A0A151GJ94_DRECN|nr:hypothetical protein DCS_04174 [Drechmeria coniospora]KYK57167.1 hypothetical protein DCS_04174 [Drechmeria coniospora]ODA79075.1 hypothetical protein RJ55_04666 [Drechmeria coniospora]